MRAFYSGIGSSSSGQLPSAKSVELKPLAQYGFQSSGKLTQPETVELTQPEKHAIEQSLDNILDSYTPEQQWQDFVVLSAQPRFFTSLGQIANSRDSCEVKMKQLFSLAALDHEIEAILYANFDSKIKSVFLQLPDFKNHQAPRRTFLPEVPSSELFQENLGSESKVDPSDSLAAFWNQARMQYAYEYLLTRRFQLAQEQFKDVVIAKICLNQELNVDLDFLLGILLNSSCRYSPLNSFLLKCILEAGAEPSEDVLIAWLLKDKEFRKTEDLILLLNYTIPAQITDAVIAEAFALPFATWALQKKQR